MIGDTYRRRSRRPWWLVAVTVLLVGLGVGLSSDGSDGAFVETLHRDIGDLESVSGPYRDMVAELGSTGRVEFTELTAAVLDELEAAAGNLDAGSPPSELTGVAEIYRLSLASWTAGATALRDEVLATAADPEGLSTAGGPPGERIADALLDLRAGDRLYGRFLAAFGEGDLPQPVTPFAALHLLPDPFPLVSASETIAAAARQPGSPLALVRSTAIEQVTTEPEWVLDTEDVLVVPETEALVFKVVVTNKGNGASDPASVTIVLSSGEGSEETTGRVGALGAGTSTTVTLPAFAVSPGEAYQLDVRLSVAEGDVDPADNARLVAFRVNEPTGTGSTAASG